MAPAVPATRFPALDGLRTVGATAVVITHVAFQTNNYTDDALGRAFARGDAGVAVFFVLSGFLLSLPMFRAAARGEQGPRTKAYLWRRALRILPAYWLTVALAMLLLPANRDASATDWLRHLTLTQVYGTAWINEGLVHTWSLCTEVAFYLALPLLVSGLLRLSGDRWRPHRVLAGLAVLAVLGFGWLAWSDADTGVLAPVNLWLPTFFGWFGAGMAMAVLAVSDGELRVTRLLRDISTSPGLCWCTAGVLYWIAATPLAGPLGLVPATVGESLIRHLLYLGVATLLVVPMVFGDGTGPLARALASRPMTWLGEVSYGLFLYHMVVLLVLVALWGPAAVIKAGMAAVLLAVWGCGVLLAAASYHLMERPLMRRWRLLVPETPAPTSPASIPVPSRSVR